MTILRVIVTAFAALAGGVLLESVKASQTATQTAQSSQIVAAQ